MFLIAVISGGVSAIPAALFMSWIGAIYAIILAGPIALILGALLTALGARFDWARSAWTWSAAGAVAGLLFLILLFGAPRMASGGNGGLANQWIILAAACVAVGVVSANMFRWTISGLNRMFAPRQHG